MTETDQPPDGALDAGLSVSSCSLSSLLVAPVVGDHQLGSATGFVVEREGRFYLVTNRHVVRGRHNETDAPLSPTAALPDALVVFHHDGSLDEGEYGEWVAVIEPLYEDGEPRWLEHPVYAGTVDVVALPLTSIEGVKFITYNPGSPGLDIGVGVSDTVSIIGFPFGRTGGAGALAIWVTGTVATEPVVDFDGLPLMLVDSRTRQGQSGSPVVAYRPAGSTRSVDGQLKYLRAAAWRLIGVYSGRISDESDLGFVWKTKALVEILEAEHLGSAAGSSGPSSLGDVRLT